MEWLSIIDVQMESSYNEIRYFGWGKNEKCFVITWKFFPLEI